MRILTKQHFSRALRVVVALGCAAFMATGLSGCSDDITCGSGTTNNDGVCEAITVAPGQTAQEACEAKGADHKWDDIEGICVPANPFVTGSFNIGKFTITDGSWFVPSNVKFGDKFCIGDIQGACKLLEQNSFQVNLKSLVS